MVPSQQDTEMTGDRKTVYVNDQPVSIFLWAEVQHCVNAYDTELFLAVQAGKAEIVDEKGGRIGWGGFAGNGQHIYVRPVYDTATQPEIPQWVKELIELFKQEPLRNPPRSIWQYIFKCKVVYYIPASNIDTYSTVYDKDGNELCAPNGGSDGLGDGRCPDFFLKRSDEMLVWKDERGIE